MVILWVSYTFLRYIWTYNSHNNTNKSTFFSPNYVEHFTLNSKSNFILATNKQLTTQRYTLIYVNHTRVYVLAAEMSVMYNPFIRSFLLLILWGDNCFLPVLQINSSSSLKYSYRMKSCLQSNAVAGNRHVVVWNRQVVERNRYVVVWNHTAVERNRMVWRLCLVCGAVSWVLDNLQLVADSNEIEITNLDSSSNTVNSLLAW